MQEPKSGKKWMWWVVAALGAALFAATLLCARREHSGPADAGGGKDDEHARMCAKRHPLFRPVKSPRMPGSTDPPRGQPPAPKDRMPKAAKAADAIAPQPLVAVAAAAGDGDPEAGLLSDCPPTVCGLNGTWLGSGVPFRTLHLSRYRHNEANLAVLAFLGPERDHGHRDSLMLHVDGDRLHPSQRDVVEPGSVLRLGPAETPGGGSVKATYEVKITGVADTDKFLIDCPQCARQTYHVYQFSARSLDDDCPLQVCDPDLADSSDPVPGLIGNAVIFQGDFYEPGYSVKLAAPTGYDDDTFNIACVGTAISKLHLMRHTSASQGAPTDPLPPPIDKRQAMLRMLTADYCGAGHPFTHDGVRIHFGIDLAAGHDGLLNPGPNPPQNDPNAGIDIPAGTHYRLDTGVISSVDALWTGDGATCIETPRLLGEEPAIWSEIEATCRAVNHPVKHCHDAAPGLITAPGMHLPLDSYVISQIPPSAP